MVNNDDLSKSAQVLMAELVTEFPTWSEFALGYGPAEDPDAEPRSVQFAVPSPTHAGHRLRVLLRGNTVEVTYDDARPPGPAEQLFGFQEPQMQEAARAVVDFVRRIVQEEVVVIRKPLGRLTRLLRRDDCTDLAWFRSAEELRSGAAHRYPLVYSWRGTYSRPRVQGAA